MIHVDHHRLVKARDGLLLLSSCEDEEDKSAAGQFLDGQDLDVIDSHSTCLRWIPLSMYSGFLKPNRSRGR